MSKPQITRIWLAGLIVFAIGLVVGGIGLGLMLGYGGQFVLDASGNGYNFVPTLNGFFWMTVSLMVVGGSILAAGSIVQLAAWIGACVNTYKLTDKTWFVVLLAGGLIGLGFSLVGFATMIAYLIAGPDGQAVGAHEIAASAPHPAEAVPYPATPFAPPTAATPYVAPPASHNGNGTPVATR